MGITSFIERLCRRLSGKLSGEGSARADHGGENGVADKTDTLVIPSMWDHACDLEGEGLVWDAAGNFHEGLVRVEQDGKLGFIDKTGRVVA